MVNSRAFWRSGSYGHGADIDIPAAIPRSGGDDIKVDIQKLSLYPQALGDLARHIHVKSFPTAVGIEVALRPVIGVGGNPEHPPLLNLSQQIATLGQQGSLVCA